MQEFQQRQAHGLVQKNKRGPTFRPGMTALCTQNATAAARKKPHSCRNQRQGLGTDLSRFMEDFNQHRSDPLASSCQSLTPRRVASAVRVPIPFETSVDYACPKYNVPCRVEKFKGSSSS